MQDEVSDRQIYCQLGCGQTRSTTTLRFKTVRRHFDVILLIFLLIACAEARAEYDDWLFVTPEDLQGFGVRSESKENREICTLSIVMPEELDLHLWLFQTTEKLRGNESFIRGYLSGVSQPPPGLLFLVKVRPRSVQHKTDHLNKLLKNYELLYELELFDNLAGGDGNVYELTLPKNMARNSYVWAGESIFTVSSGVQYSFELEPFCS